MPPNLNPNFTIDIGDILRDKFMDNLIMARYEVVGIDLAQNLYSLRNLSTNAVKKESFENLQIFFIKELI